MIPIPLEGRKLNENAIMPAILDFQVFLTGDLESLGELHEFFNTFLKSFYEHAEAKKISVVYAVGTMRPPTQDEITKMIPRKYHYGMDGKQVCSCPHVAARYITAERSKVTCRLCLRQIATLTY